MTLLVGAQPFSIMLNFTDPRWEQLEGGYRAAYDPRPALERLERNDGTASHWHELWNELHHQGDVGLASYAVVPHLVRVHRIRDVADWNTYGLVGVIELERHADGNPELPAWLEEGYRAAWRDIAPMALRDLGRSEDPTLTRCALGVLALARGLRRSGEVLLMLTEQETQ